MAQNEPQCQLYAHSEEKCAKKILTNTVLHLILNNSTWPGLKVNYNAELYSLQST